MGHTYVESSENASLKGVCVCVYVWTINFAFSTRISGSWGLFSRWKILVELRMRAAPLALKDAKQCQLVFMAPSNNRSISSAMSQMIIAITIMMMTILAVKFYRESRRLAGWMAWLQCGFPRKANLMTPIKCAHRQLIVVDATTDMRI